VSEIRALPGVVSAGVTSSVPLGGLSYTGMPITPMPRPADVPEQGIQAAWRIVTTEYLQTIRIPLKRGRLFDVTDSQRPAIVLSERLERSLWPDGSDALDRQVKLGNGFTYTVIGIVGDTRLENLRTEPSGTMYFQPFEGMRGLNLVIRTTAAPAEFASTLRAAVKRIDPNQPVFNVRTMDAILESNAERPRVQTTLLSSFAALALLLGAIGVAGVVSYTVERRNKDLAVRMTLGATPFQAMYNAARDGLLASGVGLALGLFCAWGLNQGLDSLLFQVRPDDPTTFIGVAVTLLTVAVVACWLPARRATRIDPATVLKRE